MPDTTVVDTLMRDNVAPVEINQNDARRVIGPLGGRYSDVPLHVWSNADYEKRTNDRLTLRIDADDGAGEISGDIFKPGCDIVKGRPIGERRDWALSFFGRLTGFVPEDDGARFFGLCNGVAANARPGGPQIGFVVELLVNPSGTCIREIKLAQVVEDASGYNFEQQWRAEQPGEPDRNIFRRVHIRYAVTKAAEDRGAVLDPLFEESDDFFLGHTLEAAGIAARFERLDIRANPYNEIAGDFDKYAPNRLIQSELSGSVGTKYPDTDWQAFILFAAVQKRAQQPFSERTEDGTADASKSPVAKSAALGYALGLAENASRFRSRFGAVINLAALGGISDWAPDHLGADRRFSYLTRQTTLHEFGHLLNLPHPWNREHAHQLVGPSNPASPTILNYPTRHPFGWASVAVTSQVSEWEDTLFADASGYGRDATKQTVLSERMRTFEDRHRYGQFDEGERRFIRHAPFDQIAEGGRSFKDARRASPQFGRQEPVAGKKLELVQRSGGKFVALKKLKSFTWLSSGVAELPPLPLWIRVVDGEGNEQAIGPVSFGMGHLQLLLKEDMKTGDIPHETSPRLAAIDPGEHPMIQTRKARMHFRGAPPGTQKKFEDCYEPVFWISHEMLSDALGGVSVWQARTFWLQAQYYDGDARLCSNAVLVDVTDLKEFPKGKSALSRAKNSGNVAELTP